MSKTVIGAFENNSEALQAKEELLAAGFREQSMQVHYSTPPEENGHQNHNPGFMEAIRSLFTWNLDDYRDESYADHYAEAVRRGHAVLTITVDDSEVEMVCDLMDDAGALDIDRKVSEWQSQGYGSQAGSGEHDMHSGITGAATGAVAGNRADSGLGQTTGGRTTGSGTPVVGQGNLDSSANTGLNTNLNQGLGAGREDQGVSTPTSRHNVRVLTPGNEARRSAARP